MDAAASFAILGDYYFSANGPQRGFAGIGAGRFESGKITVTDADNIETEFDGSSSAGIITRVGYEFGHLRISGEYNYLFKEGDSNYFGVHLGLTLWGGYKGSSK